MKIRNTTFDLLGLALISASGLAVAQDLPVPAIGITAPTPQEAAAAERSPITLPGVPAVAPAANGAPANGVGAKPSTAPTAAAGVLTPKLQPQSVTIILINGSTMTGTLSETDQWSMKTSLGTTTLPLSAVAGIKMAQEGNATTTVVLHNGDSITGAVQIDNVALQTDWGRAEIYGTHVASILFTPGLKWLSEPGLNGTRWKLAPDESSRVSAPVAAAPAATTSATASVAPAAPAATIATQPRVIVPSRPGPRP